MITEDKLRNAILIGISIVRFILLRVFYLKVALIVLAIWGLLYLGIYVSTGFHAHQGAIYAGFVLFYYVIYVIVKNAVNFYRWLYQK